MVFSAAGVASVPSLASSGGRGQTAPLATSSNAAIGPEVVARRGKYSRTFKRSDGSLEVNVSSRAVNYRDGAGKWQPIDNGLERQSDGAYINRANSFHVMIPAAATGSVQVTSGAHSLGFSLKGADAGSNATLAGSSAEYPHALPNTTVAYSVLGDELKETLTLATATAPAADTFVVDAPGLSARVEPSGEVAFVDPNGISQFQFATPWMTDAAGNVSRAASYRVASHTADQTTISLTLDHSWLAAPQRAFPVTVDPTVYDSSTDGSPADVCEIVSSDAPGSNAGTRCSPTWTPLIGRDVAGVHRAVLSLDTASVVPKGSLVTSALLQSLDLSTVPAAGKMFELHPLTRPFGNGATWYRSAPPTLWTTPGGDFAPSSTAQTAIALHTPEVDFPATHLVQNWSDGGVQGALIKATDENASQVQMLGSFDLAITYRARTGADDRLTIDHPTWEGKGVDGAPDVGVNVANGNLVVSAMDINLPGDGGELTFQRYWNSLGYSSPGTFGENSRGDFGTIQLDRNPTDGSYTLDGPGGDDGVFVKRPDGTFEAPNTMHAVLAEEPGGTIQMTYDDTGEVWTFDATAAHRLATISEPSGYVVTATYGTNGLTSLGDGQGDSYTFGYDATGAMRTIIDQTGATRHYDYDAHQNLIAYTDPSGHRTSYQYDPQDRLDQITYPTLLPVAIDYNPTGADNSVSEIYTPEDGHKTNATLYSYGVGSTTVTPPVITGSVIPTTYDYDGSLFVTTATRGTHPPTIALSGPLYAAQFTTLPEGDAAVSFTAADTTGAPSGGIAQVDVAVDGALEQSFTQPCATGCAGLTNSYTLSTNDYNVGEHVVSIVATNAAGDTRTQSFLIDVPPPPPFSSGTLPNDPDPAAVDETTPVGTTLCDAYYGPGSPDCQDPAANAQALAPHVAAADPFIYGIADDSEAPNDFLNSPSFDPLGISHIRRIVPFNIAANGGRQFPNRMSNLRAQLHIARLKGLDVMVSFGAKAGTDTGTSESDAAIRDDQRYLPTKVEYERDIRAFKSAFPRVDTFSAWNEPNNRLQPNYVGNDVENRANPNGGPRRAALYTFLLSKYLCHTEHCRVVAADMEQGTGTIWINYLNTYRTELARLIRTDSALSVPAQWGIHPYPDVRAMKQSGTDTFVRDRPMGTNTWFTEVGYAEGANTQANEAAQETRIRYLLNTLTKASSSIRRVYVYSLCAPNDANHDDYGLLRTVAQDPTTNCASQQPRPSWAALRNRSNP